MNKFSTTLKFAALSAVLVLGACTHKEEAVATAPPPAPPPAAPPAPPPPAPARPSIIPGSAQDFKVNVGDTVHFAYNEYAVQDNDKSTLGKQAAWLSQYPAVKLTIEGNCDERGTREYNLALGARRANAVKEYLVAQGVPTDVVNDHGETALQTALNQEIVRWKIAKEGAVGKDGDLNAVLAHETSDTVKKAMGIKSKVASN